MIVLSGKDKGKNGKVLKIIKSKVDTRVKAIVEGVNVVKKHTKQSELLKVVLRVKNFQFTYVNYLL